MFSNLKFISAPSIHRIESFLSFYGTNNDVGVVIVTAVLSMYVLYV